ncbi:LOW QUALITY PROTEIN: uncharacterized protein [Prorops nasuta]|uniref:LOW QUALITY PROTEIN: uncharacterized protein n=1 Tax=Prorops nasuta TaxID=863751 RepID=UPI0034CF1DA0
MHKGREVTVNPFYQSDFNYSIQVNRWLFKLVGAWPRSFAELNIFKILQNALTCLEYIFLAYMLIPNLLYILWDEDDLELQIKFFFPLLAWIITFVKYCWLLINGNDIFCCLKNMENDWRRVDRYENRDIMLNHAKIARYIITMSIYNLFGQTIADLLLTAILANSSNLAILLVVLVSDRETGDETNRQWKGNSETVKSKIAIIVRQHIYREYRDNYEPDVSCRISGACLHGFFNIKVTLNNIEKVYKNLLTDLIILVSITLNIFVICFMGEFLLRKCKEIGETAYMIEWYRLPGKGSLDLILLEKERVEKSVVDPMVFRISSFINEPSVIRFPLVVK